MSLPQESPPRPSKPGRDILLSGKRPSMLGMVVLAIILIGIATSIPIGEILRQKSRVLDQVMESGGKIHVSLIGPECLYGKVVSVPVILTHYDGIWWVHANDQDLADLKNAPLVTAHFTFLALRDTRFINRIHYSNEHRERWQTARVTDEGLSHIALLGRLEFLDLSYTEITDEGLRHLVGLKRLTKLELKEVSISGRGFESLKSLPNLQEVILAHSSVDDQGLLKLADISSLRRVNAVGTKVTLEGVAEFKRLRPDCRVDH